MGKTGTRAGYNGAITTTELKDGKTGSKTQGFGVFAYNTGASDWATAGASTKPNFMYNQQVYWDTDWKYEPVKYWPNGKDAANSTSPSNTATEGGVQMLSFFAYAPYVPVTVTSGVPTGDATKGIIALTSNSTTGAPKLTYRYNYSGTIGSGEKYDLGTTNNVDLLWGTRTTDSYNETDNTASAKPAADSQGNSYNVDLTKQNTTETIDFNFKHALAKFGGYEGTKSGIKVVGDFDNNSNTPTTTGSGSKDAATLITLNSITISNISSSNTPNGGVFDLTTGLWTANTTKISFSNSYASADPFPTNLNTQVWEPTTPPTHPLNWSITGVDGTVKDVFVDDTDALYFVPRITGQKIKIQVQYTVRTYDPNLAKPDGESVTCSKVVQTITNEVEIASLLENHFYTLVIHLGMTSVKFSAVVEDWATADSENNVIWLPSNVIGS